MPNEADNPVESLRLVSVGLQSALFYTRSGELSLACSVNGREDFAAFVALLDAAPRLLYALRQIMAELPAHRDWLDPTVEAAARAAIAKMEG